MARSIKFLLCCIALLVSSLAQAISSQAEASPVAVADNLVEGTVVETIDVGGYSYVGINDNGQIIWAATRGSTVAVGEEVEITGGSVMTNFTSESLGRTFETIIFTGKIIKR